MLTYHATTLDLRRSRPLQACEQSARLRRILPSYVNLAAADEGFEAMSTRFILCAIKRAAQADIAPSLILTGALLLLIRP
jgi:hypothetical protein